VHHPFQLCQQRSLLYTFCTYHLLARTAGGNKKKKDVLLLFVNMKAFLFSIQYEHASFPCVLQPETISYAGKSLIVHIKMPSFENFISSIHHISKPQMTTIASTH
jgi:hypothetical protein